MILFLNMRPMQNGPKADPIKWSVNGGYHRTEIELDQPFEYFDHKSRQRTNHDPQSDTTVTGYLTMAKAWNGYGRLVCHTDVGKVHVLLTQDRCTAPPPPPWLSDCTNYQRKAPKGSMVTQWLAK
eukprot:g43644.t1